MMVHVVMAAWLVTSFSKNVASIYDVGVKMEVGLWFTKAAVCVYIVICPSPQERPDLKAGRTFSMLLVYSTAGHLKRRHRGGGIRP